MTGALEDAVDDAVEEAGVDTFVDAFIDAFIDALWLEDGLSKNTLTAYRRDLTLFSQWLAKIGRPLPAATQVDILSYFSARHATSKATTAHFGRQQL